LGHNGIFYPDQAKQKTQPKPIFFRRIQINSRFNLIIQR
jgi:hypothetical protein